VRAVGGWVERNSGSRKVIYSTPWMDEAREERGKKEKLFAFIEIILDRWLVSRFPAYFSDFSS
jgi:hypothetical protein